MEIKAVKGCINPECEGCKKKTHYYETTDMYCVKCGNPLSFVCKKCHTVLPDGSTKLCVSCQAEADDKKEARKKTIQNLAKGAGSALTVVAAVVIGKKKD